MSECAAAAWIVGGLAIVAGNLRLENDFCTAQNRPTRCFRVTPAFMANHDTKNGAVQAKNSSYSVRDVMVGFALWCDLVLGLVTEQATGRGDDEGAILEPDVAHPFHTDDGGGLVLSASGTEFLHGFFHYRLVRWREGFI